MEVRSQKTRKSEWRCPQALSCRNEYKILVVAGKTVYYFSSSKIS